MIHGPNIPGSYAILLFTASDFTSITSHIHHWVLFLLCIFIYPGVISSLISSSILGTYRPREFIFQCPIFLPFHTVHGVLKARILKWFAIPFSSGPRLVRTLHQDPSILVALDSTAHTFTEFVMSGHEFEQAPGVGAGQGSLACCSPWGHRELDTTERLN